MEKAKQAVSSFISGDGHHKTTVSQDANQAITEEQVMPHQHENVTTAVDKEVHQDHHHTTVQPIRAKETLRSPEKHHHNMAPTTHKEINHGNERETRDTLDREAAKFKNTSVTHNTTHSSSTAPVVTGERVHHHVHEHIQPVIQKETIQPHVVHTTVPIHETHHNKPIHHGTTVLPEVTLNEFNKNKTAMEGRSHKLTEYDGCPSKFDKELQPSEHSGLTSHGAHSHGSHHGHRDHHHNSTGKTAAAAGAAAVGGAAAASHKHHKDHDEKEHHHGPGKATAAAGATTAGIAATKAHNSSGQNASARGIDSSNVTNSGVGSHENHHGSGKAAAAAGAAANKHHNNTTAHNTAANQGISSSTTSQGLNNGHGHGAAGQGYESQRASDSVAAAQAANSKASNGMARDNVADGHANGNKSQVTTAQGILHGTHTTTGDNNYTTSGNGTASGLNGGASLNKTEPRFGSSAGTAGHASHHGQHSSSSDHAASHDSVDAIGKKVSLVDKLNPFKDADGDGHRGIMS
ncbi:allergen [Colletotrichum plurivorum]|uniref:Allergen n=1 Tax=Colletotrichum plurivorum TaxID=2175906 RepID=A0A8H6JD14_9PEZI|nr:allergen [Colletotrichum plurivorum]